ncbi:MAG TPA: HAD-IIB family hydrolase, partial [Polyangiaceae bacterium]|nr:HAD-IIB family hydrolase [Polyangiaceae bacterium]
FDLDDTLLDHGQLSEVAYSALFRLRATGLRLLAVTGRPAGWGEVLARIWPVDGLVTENGSVAVLRDGQTTKMLDEVDAATRAARTARRDALVAKIREQFPFLLPAGDNRLRRADYTFDIGETQSVPCADVDRVEEFARSHGARTVRSSVHLHVCYDGSDKGSGAVRTIVQSFGGDATTARARFAFIGDSENDEPAFNTFQITVGVANLRGRPTLPPRYVTQAERGRGFAEFADRLVELRDRD